MDWNKWIRQLHRWLSVIFTLAVVAVFVAQGLGEPPEWVYVLPLAPLALLWLTGAYLFVLPYARRRRQSTA